MIEELKRRLVGCLPRDLLIDLMDMAPARAREAHKLINDYTDLQGRSARGLEGQARFRLMEKGFQDACERHGGQTLADGLIPGTKLRFFQPFMRFGGDGPGVILGLASMPARREVPTKNQSRLSGVTLNYALTPRLSLDKRDPRPGDVFALFLVARDPGRAGEIDEMAIGLINSKYESFVFYEAIEPFFANYVATPTPEAGAPGVSKTERLVKLRPMSKPYRAPEIPKDPADDRSADLA